MAARETAPSVALRGTVSACFFVQTRPRPLQPGSARSAPKAELAGLLRTAGFDVLEEGGLVGLTAILGWKRLTAPSIARERR